MEVDRHAISITATYLSAACGFTQPVYGDLTGTGYDTAGCIDYVDVAAFSSNNNYVDLFMPPSM